MAGGVPGAEGPANPLTRAVALDAAMTQRPVGGLSSVLEWISIQDTLSPMSGETVVFKVGKSVAVRLVGECRLPRGTRVRERWEGTSIVIEPVVDAWPAAFLASAGTWDQPVEGPGRNEPPRDPFCTCCKEPELRSPTRDIARR